MILSWTVPQEKKRVFRCRRRLPYFSLFFTLFTASWVESGWSRATPPFSMLFSWCLPMCLWLLGLTPCRAWWGGYLIKQETWPDCPSLSHHFYKLQGPSSIYFIFCKTNSGQIQDFIILHFGLSSRGDFLLASLSYRGKKYGFSVLSRIPDICDSHSSGREILIDFKCYLHRVLPAFRGQLSHPILSHQDGGTHHSAHYLIRCQFCL